MSVWVTVEADEAIGRGVWPRRGAARRVGVAATRREVVEDGARVGVTAPDLMMRCKAEAIQRNAAALDMEIPLYFNSRANSLFPPYTLNNGIAVNLLCAMDRFTGRLTKNS